MRLPGPLVVLATAWLALALAPGAMAQSLTIGNAAQPMQTIDLATMQALPQVDTHVAMLTGHGTVQATYRGALLWTVLQKAGVISSDERSHVRTTVLVTGRDGYTAVLALAEIDPAFEGKPVIVADRQDGRALNAGELRLVVPGDKRGGRSVRDVVKIELR